MCAAGPNLRCREECTMATDQLTQPLEHLRQLLAEPFTGRERAWAEELCQALGRLACAWRGHVADTEGRGGLAATVDLTRPSLFRELADVRREHADFSKQTQDFANRVQQTASAFDQTSGDARTTQRLPAPTPAAGLVDLGSLRDEAARF